MRVIPGLYRHYKGKEYIVIGEGVLDALLPETVGDPISEDAFVVIYRPLYGGMHLTVRTKKNFCEKVQGEFEDTPAMLRFELIRAFPEVED